MPADPQQELNEALSASYRIEEELERGGMAVVFRARDLRHDRHVAIKVLSPALSTTLATDRFLREIDVLAGLQHPHILTLIDSGEAAGLPYYVMPLVEGRSLRARLDDEGPLPIGEALRIAAELAEALEYAHRRDVLHRDVKPGNVLLSGGHAVLADFGIAAALDDAAMGQLTATGTSLGSPAYMSPEQASGDDVDARTDVYALGSMLYEMLAGELPFSGSPKTIATNKLLGKVRPLKELRPGLPHGLDRIVERAMAVDRDDRFATAEALRQAIVALERDGVTAGPGGRRAFFMVALLAAVLALGGIAAIQRVRADAEREVWRTRTLAEIERLAEADHYVEALALARELDALFPGDTALGPLYPRFSFSVPIRTDPPGSAVYRQAVDAPADEWEYLGETPIDEVRFAGLRLEGGLADLGRGDDFLEERVHRLRFELEGYRDVALLQTAVLGVNWRRVAALDPVPLTPDDSLPEEMVRIPGFPAGGVEYGAYFIDRYEVTNRQFKEFVDDGGYTTPDYWTEPFAEDDRTLGFDEAMARFTDQTGRRGPATWRLGAHPDGSGDHPVAGVSWYEAAAYAEWAGKELPTTYHWYYADRYHRENSYIVLPRSNLGGDGPRPVGQGNAMSTLGVYDLRGNVREWLYNPGAGGGRVTIGGAWTDSDFLSGWRIPKDPFQRDPTHGFRTVRPFDADSLLEPLRLAVQPTEDRDYWSEAPASDAEFEVYRSFYTYDEYSLDARIEEVDTTEHWVRQRVAFDLPYGERGGAYLYLPHHHQRPLQAVVYWGGAMVLSVRSIDEDYLPGWDFIVRAGRAVAVPIFKGGYERDEGYRTTWASLGTGTDYRDHMIAWAKDLSATIDYLETRDDIDADRIGYAGLSWGGQTGPIVLAVEPRIRAAVLNVGGLSRSARYRPEADPFNFVTHVTTPVLMINGEHDTVFPYETSQRPLFELLGTADEHKRHYLSEASHLVPRNEAIRETLNWFDRYLGPPPSR